MLKRRFKKIVQPSPKAAEVAKAIELVKILDTNGVLEALVPKEVFGLLRDKTGPIKQQEMGAFSRAIIEDAKTYTQVKELLLKRYPNLAPKKLQAETAEDATASKPSKKLELEILLLLKAKETLFNLGFPVVEKIFNDCPRNRDSTEFVETFLEHCKRYAEHIALMQTYCDTYYVEQKGKYLPDEGFKEVHQAIETFVQEDDTLQILQQLTKEELRLILQSQKHHKQKNIQIAEGEVLSTLQAIREQAEQYVQVRNLVLQGASKNDVSSEQLLQLVEKLVETKVLYKIPFSVIETMYDAFYEEHKNRMDIEDPIQQLVLPFLEHCKKHSKKQEKEYNTYIEGIKKYCEFYYLEKGKTKRMPKGGFPEVNEAIDTFKKDKATREAFTRLSKYDIDKILKSFQDAIEEDKVLQRLEAIRERAKQWEPSKLLTGSTRYVSSRHKGSKVKLLFDRSKSKQSVKKKDNKLANLSARPKFKNSSRDKSTSRLSVGRRLSKISFRKVSKVGVEDNHNGEGSNSARRLSVSFKFSKKSSRRKGENNNNEFDFIAAIDGGNVVKKVIYTVSRKVSKILMVVPVEKKNQLLTDRVEMGNFSTSSGSETLSGRKKKGKKSKSKKKKKPQVGSIG